MNHGKISSSRGVALNYRELVIVANFRFKIQINKGSFIAERRTVFRKKTQFGKGQFLILSHGEILLCCQNIGDSCFKDVALKGDIGKMAGNFKQMQSVIHIEMS